MKKIFLPVVILVCMYAESQAQFRKYSNEFMNIGVGARALGMSGSEAANVNDVTAGYWNPAGLKSIEDNIQIAAMHSEYFAGIAKYDYLGVAKPIKDGDKVLAFSILRFAVDDIPNTLFLKEPDGTINYDNITSFSVANYAFIASYAAATQVDGLNFGANFKIIHNQVGSFARSWGAGADAGVQYVRDNLRLGAVVKDITTTFNAWTFSFSEKEQAALLQADNAVPKSSTELTAPKIVLGGGYLFQIGERITLIPELNLDLTTDGKRNVLIPSKLFSVDPHFGLEAGYSETVYLRAGIGNIQKATNNIDGGEITMIQPNIGVGLKIKSVTVDYAFTNIGNFSSSLYSHVFSLKLSLNPDSY